AGGGDVRWAGPARRVRARPGDRAGRDVRRRADRIARQPRGGARDGAADPGRHRTGCSGGARDPRSARRRLCPPRDHRPRWSPERGRRVVIRLGLRLALSGGRGAAIGLALTAFAVAVGTAILLFALSFLPALDDRAQRAAWRTNFVMSESGTSEDAGLLIRSDGDVYAGEPLVRILVAGL